MEPDRVPIETSLAAPVEGDSTSVDLVRESAAALLVSYFMPETMAEGLKATGFTGNEAVQVLVDIFRNHESAYARLAAKREIDRMLKEALTMAGKLRMLTAHEERVSADGMVKQTLEAKTVQLFRNALKEVEQGTTLPALEEKKDEHDEQPTADPSSDPAESGPEPETDAPGAGPAIGEPDPAGSKDDVEVLVDGFRPATEGHFPPEANPGGVSRWAPGEDRGAVRRAAEIRRTREETD